MKFENLEGLVGFWSKSRSFDVIACTYRPVSIRKRTQARIIEKVGDLEDLQLSVGGV